LRLRRAGSEALSCGCPWVSATGLELGGGDGFGETGEACKGGAGSKEDQGPVNEMVSISVMVQKSSTAHRGP
jgi:hypothetical protein